MHTDPTHFSTSPTRLAVAVTRLLDASERAATRGHTQFALTYTAKAAEASATLHNQALDALASLAPRRITKAESQHGRLM